MQEKVPEGVRFITEESGIREYRLANGMKVLLQENHVAPVATVLVVYKVGSRNEATGYTGATHLLEHMMFKGTPTFNKEKNSQVAATLQKIGADFNATTWLDRTNYFETVPSDRIELAIQLEADRMRNSFIADSDRQSEMTVVRNELELGQNEPSEVLDEATYATAFREHPYHHPTIGWRSDVEGVPTSRLKAFYDTFYQPNNATAIVVGDFDRTNALQLITKYFGAYPASKQPIPEVYTEEPPQQGERRFVIRRVSELALIQIAFHTPGALGQMTTLSNEKLQQLAANPSEQNDTYPLAVLSAALSNGVTSRLYQALVEKQLAVKVNTVADQHRDPGLFNITATVQPGIDPKRVEDVIFNELKQLADRGLKDEEIARAKQQVLAEVAYNRDGTFNIAEQMSEAEAVADWRFYKDYSANVAKVTAADVKRALRTYFTEENRTVGYFIPRPSGEGAPSESGGESAMLKGKRSIFQRGVKFYKDPETGGDQTPETFPEQGPRSDSGAPAKQPATPQSGFASRIARTELPTGARLLVLENTATPTVAYRASLLAGTYFEPRDKPGLARVTMEMLDRGTRKRNKLQIASEIESAGAEIEYQPGIFAVNIYARSLSNDLPMIMRDLAEELREPSFPAEELEKVKQQVIASIQEEQADTFARAYERFTELVFDKTNPFHQPAGDTLIKSINSITVADVRRFYSEAYGGRSLVVAVAGNVNVDEVRRQFEQNFGGFSGPRNLDVNVADPSQHTGSRREVVTLKDKANVDIILGSAAPLRRSSDDYYAALLANNALGESTLSSRLGLQVRDKEGLTYGIGSRFRHAGLAGGPWYINVSVNPDNVEKAIDSAVAVLRDYVKNGILPQELADEKSSAIGAFKVSLASNAGIAEAMWNAEFYRLGSDFLDRFPQLIQGVTIDQVNRAIRKYFRPEHLTVVIAGDPDERGPSH